MLATQQQLQCIIPLVVERVSKEAPVKKIPWPGPQPLGFAFLGRIYLRNVLWEDYLTGDPGPRTLSIIAHEQAHIDRMGGDIRNNFKYWINPELRFQEELAAIREEMKTLKKYGENEFKIDERSRNLSSIWYWWCTDYQTAKRTLEDIWNEL